MPDIGFPAVKHYCKSRIQSFYSSTANSTLRSCWSSLWVSFKIIGHKVAVSKWVTAISHMSASQIVAGKIKPYNFFYRQCRLKKMIVCDLNSPPPYWNMCSEIQQKRTGHFFWTNRTSCKYSCCHQYWEWVQRINPSSVRNGRKGRGSHIVAESLLSRYSSNNRHIARSLLFQVWFLYFPLSLLHQSLYAK